MADAARVADALAATLTPWPGEPESLVVTTDDGTRIHYLDWGTVGNGDDPLPPLLLMHGLAATAWAWTGPARRLRHAARVLAMDLRGHGLSDSPRSGYDLESLAFDALTVLVANGYGTDAGGPPAVVAGHGLGAMVAATMSAIQPRSVAGLVLVDGGWEDLGDATGMTADEFARSLGDPPEVLASMAAYLADRRDYDPATWDADEEHAARAAVDEKHAGHVMPVVRPNTLRATAFAMFDYRPMETLTAVDAPVLVAVAEAGTADDEGARERRLALDDLSARRVAVGRQAPDVRRFAGAGHNLMRYRRTELSAAILDVLRASYQRS